MTPAAAALVTGRPPAGRPRQVGAELPPDASGAESMPGDPNAAFYLDGVYHLHYIPAASLEGRQSFAFIHVTSRTCSIGRGSRRNCSGRSPGTACSVGRDLRRGGETGGDLPWRIFGTEPNRPRQDRLLTDWGEARSQWRSRWPTAAATMNLGPGLLLIGTPTMHDLRGAEIRPS